MAGKKISVLIPDGENYLLKSVVNGLALVPNIDVYVMSNARNKSMRYSRYVRKFIYYPKTEAELDWIANINKVVQEHDIDVVMPVWEIGVKTLVKHKDKIVQKDRLCLLPPWQELTIAINKELLAKHLEVHQLPYPTTIPLDSIDQLDQLKGLKFPILLKPNEGFGGGHGIRIFSSIKEVKEYYVKSKIDYPCLLQEYIDGYDIDCSVLCKAGEVLAFTIQKGNLESNRKFGPPIGLDFLYESELYGIVEKLMKSLHWSGVAHIDLRYDINNKQFKVIEINTRYWGSLDASILAGVNFPYLYCLASLDQQFERPMYRFIKFLSIQGLARRIKENVFFLSNVKFIFNNTPLKFALRDPLPMFYRLLHNGND
jgi:predicted ATP-grasp superfamily ATP-dependent carboligase